MPPRPAPDLSERRALVLRTARRIATEEGWAAVTMRRLAGELGVTQPTLYSAVTGRQAVVDGIALDGFDELAASLEREEAAPLPRMRAYLDFAAANPRIYEAMFSLPSELTFAADTTPDPLLRAFAALREGFPEGDDTLVEVAWSTLHGLATLQADGRIPPVRAEARLRLAHRLFER